VISWGVGHPCSPAPQGKWKKGKKMYLTKKETEMLVDVFEGYEEEFIYEMTDEQNNFDMELFEKILKKAKKKVNR